MFFAVSYIPWVGYLIATMLASTAQTMEKAARRDFKAAMAKRMMASAFSFTNTRRSEI